MRSSLRSSGDRVGLLQEILERRPAQQLHHDEETVAVFADVEDRDDVRMGQAGGRLRLPVEPRPDVGIVVEIGRQDLERDVAAHRFVMRAVDDAHGAAADPLDDLVAADPFWRSAPRVSSSAAMRHCWFPEQRTTSAVMLSRLPCSSAVLISD